MTSESRAARWLCGAARIIQDEENEARIQKSWETGELKDKATATKECGHTHSQERIEKKSRSKWGVFSYNVVQEGWGWRKGPAMVGGGCDGRSQELPRTFREAVLGDMYVCKCRLRKSRTSFRRFSGAPCHPNGDGTSPV